MEQTNSLNHKHIIETLFSARERNFTVESHKLW